MSIITARTPKVSRKTLLNIVQEVRKRPCLWNPDDEYHNNRGRVAVAWEEVTAVLNIPEPLIKAKWKIMRDVYKREMKRCRINSKGKFQYTGKWRHFKLMWFLNKNKEAELVHYDPTEDTNSSTEEETIKEEIHNTRILNKTQAAQFDESRILTVNFEPEHNETSMPVVAKHENKYEEDYDLLFLKSLVPYFRELDSVKKLRMRNMIQDIIINEIRTPPQ